jgi:hypothetical protein
MTNVAPPPSSRLSTMGSFETHPTEGIPFTRKGTTAYPNSSPTSTPLPMRMTLA